LNIFKEFARAVTENPIFVIVLGLCPTLATTTSFTNGLGMGLATTAVMTFSNLFISMLRKQIPDNIRIPCYIIIISTFVAAVQMLLAAFFPELNSALGIFIPLIVSNCILLARAEVYAAKNSPLPSMLDGFVMGIGFTLSLALIGTIRELLGTGGIMGHTLDINAPIVFILPPGALLVMGLLFALFAHNSNKKEVNISCEGCLNKCHDHE
jgi:electron transport complex protein RnfE